MSEVPLYTHATLGDYAIVPVPLFSIQEERVYRGTSLARKRPPPQDPPRILGVGLLSGLRGVHFLVSEVPLYLSSAFRAMTSLVPTGATGSDCGLTLLYSVPRS